MLTVTDIVIVVAHVGTDDDVGVNVYVCVPKDAVDIIAFHVPAIALFDVSCKASAVASLQYGPNCVNVGIVTSLTSMSIVLVIAHVGADVDVGVNV